LVAHEMEIPAASDWRLLGGSPAVAKPKRTPAQ
jgi:hypothetical protein